ncbi:CHAD domain-containing protein [Streptacidiphilus albus]|uniref:CHAD domain-containing protein n=1 Tax=Streptacidiphilus albus TaxID=105425 RepID=UPI0009DE17B6|nr:CHAD domain-containing protein [Streptacidiphilus albus]
MTDAPGALATSVNAVPGAAVPEQALPDRAGSNDGVPGTAGEALAAHLALHAGTFLRGLPAIEPRILRRVAGALHTFEDLLDPGWARGLREELTRLGGLLGQEQVYTRRLARLTAALDALSCVDAAAAPGAPKARALLERQLSLARSRAHSLALQELGSARFHAVADRMTLLVSDLPLRNPAGSADPATLLPYAAEARRRLAEAVAVLPLQRAATPYNGAGLREPEDALPWRQVRLLALRARYALEVCSPLLGPEAARSTSGLAELARLLGRHEEAAEAAEAAALAGATPRITPATAYVLGVVHADQRLEVEAARHAFSTTWPDTLAPERLADSWLTR